VGWSLLARKDENSNDKSGKRTWRIFVVFTVRILWFWPSFVHHRKLPVRMGEDRDTNVNAVLLMNGTVLRLFLRQGSMVLHGELNANASAKHLLAVLEFVDLKHGEWFGENRIFDCRWIHIDDNWKERGETGKRVSRRRRTSQQQANKVVGMRDRQRTRQMCVTERKNSRNV